MHISFRPLLFWLLTLGSLLSAIPTQAQLYRANTLYTFDYLYLKDSTVISGWIVEQKVGEYVRIELPGGSILVVEQEKISQITRERSPYQKIHLQPNISQQAIQYRSRGMYHLVDFHLGFPEGENGNVVINPALHYRVGYQWNRWLGTGGGTGFDLLHAGLIVPVFAEVTGYLWDQPSTPFYSVQGGYGLALTPVAWLVEDVSGGLFYQGSVGMKFHTRSRTQYFFSLGWKSQMLTIDRNGGWDWNTGEPLPGLQITRPYQTLVFQVGMSL